MHRGAGAYICGEETGLIESLEGKRAWPRIKPPFPAVEGAFRKPTVVNNIETLACVTHIVDRGADWFKSIGVPPDPKNPRDAGSYGPKLYCISGHVNKPGCVELPLGITVRELVDKHGGGVWKGRKAKGCIPGGLSMGFMTEKRVRHAARLQRPRQGRLPRPGHRGGHRLRRPDEHGRRAVQHLPLLRPRVVRPVHAVPRRHRLDAARSSTACAAGRAGWRTWRSSRKSATASASCPGTTICGLADGAGWPVKNAIRKFRPEFEEYIQQRPEERRRCRWSAAH